MRMDREVPGAHGCDVYLDGEKLTRCFIADDEQGWAACEFIDPLGRHVLDRHKDTLLAEIRRGVVTFTFNPPELREQAERWWRDRLEFIGQFKATGKEA